ncbi:hypothetical protein GGS20DRAFT_195605 [Poronia punctata]|nr:hypothetical protein GGS20DRAFT_195605 [Poronia punctata]
MAAPHEMVNDDVEMGGTTTATGDFNELPPQPIAQYTSAGFDIIKSDPEEKPQPSPSSSPPPPPSLPLPLPPPSSSSSSSKPKTKKRGTATAATSRKTTTSTTTIKKSRGGGPKSKKNKNKTPTTTTTTAAAAKTSVSGGVESSEEEDETDNGPYCLCRGPDDHRWMISCDACEDWFHGECVSLDKDVGEKLVERFVCPNCTDGKRNYTKYRKTCSLVGCINPARLYNNEGKEDERSVFCSNEHCDAWWASMIATLPTRGAAKKAIEVLTQEDFLGLLAATSEKGGWKIGDKPFGNIQNLWSNGLPTRPGVLSEEEKHFLQTSAAERLALGNEIVQYKKMMQLLDWANARRQAAIEAGRFTKDSCGYDYRLDTVSVRVQFAAWLDTPEGQAVFKAGKLDAPPHPDDGDEAVVVVVDPLIRGTCDRKRCKPHSGWYKLLMSAVRVLVKETATAAATKLEAEEAMRKEAEARYERRQLENNSVEVLSED